MNKIVFDLIITIASLIFAAFAAYIIVWLVDRHEDKIIHDLGVVFAGRYDSYKIIGVTHFLDGKVEYHLHSSIHNMSFKCKAEDLSEEIDKVEKFLEEKFGRV